MIVGMGVDMVDVRRIARIYRNYGMRFPGRILSDAEIDLLPPNAAPFLAGRFAAREAAVKALGTGFSAGITCRQMEIVNDGSGRPVLRFFGRAEEKFREIGGSRIFCSISHERSHAVSVVILEG